MDTPFPINALCDDIISNIESSFSELLHIHEALEHASEGDHIGNFDVGEGNLLGAFESQIEIKCLKECSIFPYPDMMLPSSSFDEEAHASPSDQSSRQNYSCSVSLLAPRKLVSAMKGSREKEGGSQMKFTVKWAPDVYDPVPTLLSHTVKYKKQHKCRTKKSEKKNGKQSQKVNYSKRGNNKDKQCRNRWLYSRDEVFEASKKLDDLNVANRDSYCGTSFFKTSVTKVHWPIGQAL